MGAPDSHRLVYVSWGLVRVPRLGWMPKPLAAPEQGSRKRDVDRKEDATCIGDESWEASSEGSGFAAKDLPRLGPLMGGCGRDPSAKRCSAIASVLGNTCLPKNPCAVSQHCCDH